MFIAPNSLDMSKSKLTYSRGPTPFELTKSPIETSDRALPTRLNSSKSFTRYESPHRTSTPTRSRASTLANEVLSPTLSQSPDDNIGQEIDGHEKVFEVGDSGDGGPEVVDATVPSTTSLETIPEGFDKLPIELISLTDRYKEP